MPTPELAEPLQDRFQKLKDDWKSQTRHLSNSAQIALVFSYQQIIGMGIQAVPMILNELRREPDQWFWALEAITGENPVPQSDVGDVAAMSRAWIRWGTKNRLIQP